MGLTDGAENVSVNLSDSDSLGLSILNSSADAFDKDKFEWLIGDLDSGESVKLNLTAKTNKSDENLTIMSEVETSTFETNKENNLDNDSFCVLPVCDLVITINPDNDLVYVEDIVNWIINVTNNGPDNASDVNVFNSLPEGLEFILSELNKGELENISNEKESIDFNWKIGNLEKNESAYLVISTTALDEGLISNNASVISSTYDSNESNNFDTSDLQVIAEDNSNEFDNNSDDEPNDVIDEFPVFDNNSSDKNDSNLNKSKEFVKSNSKKPIDLSNKKTGNPFIGVLLSIFALVLFPFKKN